jgi:GNAT superfamily N-acetyltransferase
MTTESPLLRPVPIAKSHDSTGFDCGNPLLDEYLGRFAFANHRNHSARTYVASRDNRVAGFYSLVAGSVSWSEVPTRIAAGLGKHPIPIILLARLAVDRTEQGKGLGTAMLKDALVRCAQAAEIIGCRAVLVHAKDAAAQAFYRKFDFASSPVNELQLSLLMKDIIAKLRQE